MVRGYLYGNAVEWNGEAWVYPDDGSLAEGHPRPCPSCGKLPGPVDHDPCLNIPGATGACCGHGVHPGYVSWPNIPAPSEWWQRAYVGPDDPVRAV